MLFYATRWYIYFPYFNEAILLSEFYSAIKLTFGCIATLLSKIVTFRVIIILKSLLRRRYILKKLMFCALYGQKVSLVYISSKMKPAIMLKSMKINDFFVPELDDVDVVDLWFQQNGTMLYSQRNALLRVVGLWRCL